MANEEYIYIPLEWFNPLHWVNRGVEKTNEIINGKLQEADEEIANEIGSTVKTTLADWGSAAWDWFVSITPDLVGYSAIACAAFMILSPMAGRSMIKPFGIFSAIGIAGLAILGAV